MPCPATTRTLPEINAALRDGESFVRQLQAARTQSISAQKRRDRDEIEIVRRLIEYATFFLGEETMNRIEFL